MSSNNHPSLKQLKETKHEKFERLSAKRMQGAMEALRLLSQLTSSNYEHTPREAQRVVERVIHAAVKLAHDYGVECTARVANGTYITTQPPQEFMLPSERQMPPLGEEEIARLFDEVESGQCTPARQKLEEVLAMYLRVAPEVRLPEGVLPFKYMSKARGNMPARRHKLQS